jgi:hypothetical protein
MVDGRTFDPKSDFMTDTYVLKLAYPATLSINKIVALVESVPGVRVRKLNVKSIGRRFSGVFFLEVVDRVKYHLVLKRIRNLREISLHE